VNRQGLWFLTVCLCAAGEPNMADAADPAPSTTDESIAMQARAVGLTVKHDAEEFAKAVKEQAKKVGIAAQQGAKEVQTTVTHQMKITDDNKSDKAGNTEKAEKADVTDKTSKSEKPEPATHPK
jgi:hypothetical protein